MGGGWLSWRAWQTGRVDLPNLCRSCNVLQLCHSTRALQIDGAQKMRTRVALANVPVVRRACAARSDFGGHECVAGHPLVKSVVAEQSRLRHCASDIACGQALAKVHGQLNARLLYLVPAAPSGRGQGSSRRKPPRSPPPLPNLEAAQDANALGGGAAQSGQLELVCRPDTEEHCPPVQGLRGEHVARRNKVIRGQRTCRRARRW